MYKDAMQKDKCLDELRPANQVRLSVVIPVLEDLAQLRELLDTLTQLTDPPEEILVADGAGQAACLALCKERNCVYVTTRPGRGHQLHTAAGRAKGKIIWFLHADTRPDTNAATLIHHSIAAGADSGYFRFRFAGMTNRYRGFLEQLINWRARIGVPYGDQGLFATRDAYARTGGFPDVPLFEEVPFIRALRRRGHFVRIDAPIGVSPRRWERDGWIRRTLHNRLLALGYMLGISPATLARRYQPLADKDHAQC
jgi:rSAM/selenodomain-associated transferase 2